VSEGTGKGSVYERTRILFDALGDVVGVHLCDLAEVREARDAGPTAVLEALVAPLDRLVSTATLGGLDVVCVEALLAARELDGGELEEQVREIVVHSGSGELAAGVLKGLWDRVQDLRDDGQTARALQAARAALGMSVATSDFTAAATSLVFLSGCHEADDEMEAATLCIRQAGAYMARAGRHQAAGEVLAETSDRMAGRGQWEEALCVLDQAARSFEGAGNSEGVALCMVEGARLRIENGRFREAVRQLQRAVGAAGAEGLVEFEAKAWRLLSTAHEALGDNVMKASCEARAELLEGAVEDGHG